MSVQYSVSVQPGCCQSCPCSTMRVNWPPCTLKRKHIKLLSALPVSFSWDLSRAPPAVLPLFCCSLSWRQMVIWRGSVAAGQVSHRVQAQPISVTPWEAEVTHERGEWKGPLPWFTTWRGYRIPSAQGWFLLRRWRYTKADPHHHLLPALV